MDGSGMWGVGLLWPLLWALVFVAIVLGAVYLLTARGGGTDTDEAMERLRKRYARGEISEEEFAERASRLSGR